jgi:hypothetical protein
MVSCASNKPQEKIKSYLNTPHIQRPYHLPNEMMLWSFDYSEETESNRFLQEFGGSEEDHYYFDQGLILVADFTENLQSHFWYLPFNMGYRVKETENFFQELYFGASLYFSTLGGDSLYPKINLTQKYLINKKNALELVLDLSTSPAPYTRVTDTRKYASLRYMYQFRNDLMARLGVSLIDSYYLIDCGEEFYEHNVCRYDDITRSTFYIRDTYMPISLNLRYRATTFTEWSLFTTYKKFGYEHDYQALLYGIGFHWYD